MAVLRSETVMSCSAALERAFVPTYPPSLLFGEIMFWDFGAGICVVVSTRWSDL
jgi:hypothetical protein